MLHILRKSALEIGGLPTTEIQLEASLWQKVLELGPGLRRGGKCNRTGPYGDFLGQTPPHQGFCLLVRKKKTKQNFSLLGSPRISKNKFNTFNQKRRGQWVEVLTWQFQHPWVHLEDELSAKVSNLWSWKSTSPAANWAWCSSSKKSQSIEDPPWGSFCGKLMQWRQQTCPCFKYLGVWSFLLPARTESPN